MKWGIEHLRVTLRDDSGETVVIEQSKDGAIRCEQANGVPRKAAAEPVSGHREPSTAPEAAGSTRKEPESRTKSPRRGSIRRRVKKEAPEARPEAASRGPSRLDWIPIKDSKAWGVVAKSGSGQFKVLRSASSIWSLFYERLDADGKLAAHPELIACFPIDQEYKAHARAQEHHDRGVHVTADLTEVEYNLCPAPTPGSTEAGRTRRVRSPKAPVETEPPTPEVAAEPAVDPAMDAAIMGGLDAILKKHMSQANP